MPHTVVIQYVPDTVTNERINIGVSILHDGKAITKFLSTWTRVRQFADRDIRFLKDLEHESHQWDEKAVRRLSEQWTGSIQFAPPRFTTLSPHEALIDGLNRYLFERTVATKKYRDKQDVVRVARQQIKAKLKQLWGAKGLALIQDKEPAVPGDPSPYQFDVTVANGKPYFAAQGISFQIPETKSLDKEVWSTQWLLQNRNDHYPEVKVAIVVAKPTEQLTSNDAFNRATSRFKDLGADVIDENSVSRWAEGVSMELAPIFASV